MELIDWNRSGGMIFGNLPTALRETTPVIVPSPSPSSTNELIVAIEENDLLVSERENNPFSCLAFCFYPCCPSWFQRQRHHRLSTSDRYSAATPTPSSQPSSLMLCCSCILCDLAYTTNGAVAWHFIVCKNEEDGESIIFKKRRKLLLREEVSEIKSGFLGAHVETVLRKKNPPALNPSKGSRSPLNSVSTRSAIAPFETGLDSNRETVQASEPGIGMTIMRESIQPSMDCDEEIDYEWTKKKRLCLTFTDDPPITTTFRYLDEGEESYRMEIQLDEICKRVNALMRKKITLTTAEPTSPLRN